MPGLIKILFEVKKPIIGLFYFYPFALSMVTLQIYFKILHILANHFVKNSGIAVFSLLR